MGETTNRENGSQEAMGENGEERGTPPRAYSSGVPYFEAY
jgi:hypothetical protein